MIKTKKIKTKGVTLLLAILISSVALTLGLGVSVILLGELGLAGTAKESLEAFYAADSGVECALYWDIKQLAFSTTTVNSISCAGASFNVGGGLVSNFSVDFSGGCAKIKVNKTNPLQTVVTSLGENKSCSAVSSPKTVQRGLEVKY